MTRDPRDPGPGIDGGADQGAPRPPPLTLAIVPGLPDRNPQAPPTAPLTGPDHPLERRPRALLAQVDHGPAHGRCRSDPRRLSVGLATLTPPTTERWTAPAPVDVGWSGDIGFAQGPEVLFAHLLLDDAGDADLATLTLRAYTQLLRFIRDQGFPHPLRMWNVLSRIHASDAGLERYQAFCVGRQRAFSLAGIAPTRFPAATAVGASARGLLVYLLAGRVPGLAVENPRQISAYRYPLRYGPRPPSFARGLRPAWPGGNHFFVSGTASVVGHQSLHPGRLAPQLRETLANLDALLDAAGAQRPCFLKVFLRDARDLPTAQAGLQDWAEAGAGAGTPVIYLQAQVCRTELEIEIEGVCGPVSDASE